MMAGLAAAIGTALGRDLTDRDVTLAEYRAGLLAVGLDEGTAVFVAALEDRTARGELDVAPDDLETLLGRPATDLQTAVKPLV